MAAELGQYEPSPQACRHTPAPGRAAGGPRRFCLPQAPTAQTRPVFFPQAPTVQTCVSAGAPAAKLRPTTRSRRRSIAARASTIPTKPDIFTQSRCISAVSFFSCCDSVAALALANCNEHVAEANISRSHPPTPSVLCTVPKAREVKLIEPLNFSARLATAARRWPVARDRSPALFGTCPEGFKCAPATRAIFLHQDVHIFLSSST